MKPLESDEIVLHAKLGEYDTFLKSALWHDLRAALQHEGTIIMSKLIGCSATELPYLQGGYKQLEWFIGLPELLRNELEKQLEEKEQDNARQDR